MYIDSVKLSWLVVISYILFTNSKYLTSQCFCNLKSHIASNITIKNNTFKYHINHSCLLFISCIHFSIILWSCVHLLSSCSSSNSNLLNFNLLFVFIDFSFLPLNQAVNKTPNIAIIKLKNQLIYLFICSSWFSIFVLLVDITQSWSFSLFSCLFIFSFCLSKRLFWFSIFVLLVDITQSWSFSLFSCLFIFSFCLFKRLSWFFIFVLLTFILISCLFNFLFSLLFCFFIFLKFF